MKNRSTEQQRLLDLMRRVSTDLGVTSIRALAARFGVTTETIYKWCRAERVPIAWAKKIEQDTQGRVTREMVSPWAYH